MLMKIIKPLVFILMSSTAAQTMADDSAAVISDLSSPVGMVYDQQGNLYVAEWSADRISKIYPDGKRAVVTEAVRNPAGLAFDDRGILYIASYGDGSIYALQDDNRLIEIAAGLSSPTGLIWTREKYLLVANRNAGQVVKITLDGTKEILAENMATPVGLTQTSDGSIFVSCFSGGIDMISVNGEIDTIYRGLRRPGVGIAADGEEVLAVDYDGNTVARINRQGQASTVMDNLRSPVGLVKNSDGTFLVGTWGDNAAFIINGR